MSIKNTIAILLSSLFTLNSSAADFGYNLISLEKNRDGLYVHNIVDDLYFGGQSHALDMLRQKKSKYVRIFLNEKFYIEKNGSFFIDNEYVERIADVIKKFNNSNISVVVVFGYWIPRDILSRTGYESVCGDNDVFSSSAYTSLWAKYIVSFVENENISKLDYMIDIRNETYIDTKSSCGVDKLRQKFIDGTNFIVKKIREKNKSVKISMSVFCPMNVGRSGNFLPSRSGDKRNPIPVDWLNDTEIDYIDLHIYYGGWSGKDIREHLSGCVDGDYKKTFFVGEIGFSKKFFNEWPREKYKSDVNFIVKKLNPKFFLLWSMVNSGEDVMDFLDVGDVFYED